MQFDLNRLSLEANALARISRSGSSESQVSVDIFPSNQVLAHSVPVTDMVHEVQNRETTNLSNEPNVSFSLLGSYRRAIHIRTLPFEMDILTNVPLEPSHVATWKVGSTRDPWDVIEGLIGTIDGPSDWSDQHDHYLYGTPKS